MKLHIQVKPGRKKEKLEFRNDVWVASISARAVDGKANVRLIDFLSEVLKIPKSKIVILKGHASSYKVLEILDFENIMMKNLKSIN